MINYLKALYMATSVANSGAVAMIFIKGIDFKPNNNLSGEEVARVVVNKLKELNIFGMISGICFDTCAANTGWAKGEGDKR